MNQPPFFSSARLEVQPGPGSSRSRSRAGEMHVAIPAKECLIQVVDVPSVDADELEGMMALRAEEFSPFPLDRTHWSWEEIIQTESESRVLFVLTGHRLLEALHEEGHGQVPKRVDLDVLGWWTLIEKTAPQKEADSCLELILEPGQAFLLALESGILAGVIPLGNLSDCGTGVFLEELELALGGVEAERGRLTFSAMTVWRSPEAFEALDFSAVERELGIQVTVNSLETLPPLAEGVEARGVLSQSRRLVDLAPVEWKQEAHARALRQRILTGAVAIGAVWLLLVASFSGYVWAQGRALSQLEAEMEGKADSVREVLQLSERVRSLSQFTDRSTSALEILRMLAEASPGTGRLLIRDLHYRKDHGVTVSGEATGDFFQFQEMLSASPLLRVETFETREVRGQTEFRLATAWRWREDQP